MVSRFNTPLHLMDPANDKPVGGLRAGPCGRGPIDSDDGKSLVSMQVWFFQEHENGVAMASGRTSEDPKARPSDGEPAGDGDWMLQTGLEAESAEFSTDQPAKAMAVAIVEDRDGNRTVEQWDQEIALHATHGDHDH